LRRGGMRRWISTKDDGDKGPQFKTRAGMD
jgi:hypothetical protein